MHLRTFKICLKIYELDPAKFLSTPGLSWQPAWKTTKVRLDLLTDIDMLFIVEILLIIRLLIHSYIIDIDKYLMKKHNIK